MSRQKQLSVVFDVANAQKQGAIEGECTEPRSATMLHELTEGGQLGQSLLGGE